MTAAVVASLSAVVGCPVSQAERHYDDAESSAGAEREVVYDDFIVAVQGELLVDQAQGSCAKGYVRDCERGDREYEDERRGIR